MANLRPSAAVVIILLITSAAPGFAQAPPQVPDLPKSVSDCLAMLAKLKALVSTQARHQLGPDGPVRKINMDGRNA